MPLAIRSLLLALTALLSDPPRVAAHFLLHLPASWRDQDAVGSPQKVGPCGEEGTAAMTGAVTSYAAGETITITLDETIYHPGHYRVALAVNDRSELPAEPPVTPGATECGSVPVQDAPVFPVLADGVLEHATPFSETQSIQVTLPSNVTCTHCTLQVLEFMSSHPAPCFYHHCADIAVGAGTAPCIVDGDCVDADACTLDTCAAGQGCRHDPMTLATVTPGFLGTLAVDPCATDRVPPPIGALFSRADRFVGRATETPAKAQRFLDRASRKLRSAASKAAKASGKRIGAECGAALDTVLGDATQRVDCLLGAIRAFVP